MKIKLGQIVKMRGTRDKGGYRLIYAIKTDWCNNQSIVCFQLAPKAKSAINPSDKIALAYEVKIKDKTLKMVLFETNIMTEHMPNKISHVYYNGGWLKIADYESLVEID